MGTFNFSNLPGYQDALKRIEGGAVNGNDGPQYTNVDLDFTREYHVTVVEAKSLVAGTGTEGFLLVLEVTDPGEFEGQRVWFRNYIQANPPAFIVARLATISSAFVDGPPMGEVSWDVYAAKAVGAKFVAAFQETPPREGDDRKYTEVRWINRDIGQRLQTNIKPKGAKTASGGLTAAVIPGLTETAPAAAPAPAHTPAATHEPAPAPAQAPEQEAAPAVQQTAPVTAPADSGVRPAGIRLPGM